MAGTTDPESRPSELPPGPPYARRLDRWVEELRAAAIVNAENTEFTDFVHRMRDQFGGEDNVSLLSWLMVTKELIFDIEDGKPTFHDHVHARHQLRSRPGSDVSAA